MTDENRAWVQIGNGLDDRFIEDIGFHMFFVLRTYQMTEAEFADEVASDRDLVRQGFMSPDEFKKKTSLRRLAREVWRRDDMPARAEAWLWSDLWGDISGKG